MTLLTNLPEINALIVGAGHGIGCGFVQHLLKDAQVARIFATTRDAASATELQHLRTEHPQRLTLLSLEMTQEEQIAQRVAQIQAEVAKLHLVINCVGILHEGEMQPEKSLRQINAEQLLRYFQVNSIGTPLLAKYLLPLLKHGDRSVFASISAKIGSIGDNHLGGWYGYRASKAALNMFVRTIAIEYSRRSPQTVVIALHPGTTDTRLSHPFQKNVPPEKLFSVDRTVQQLLEVIGTRQISDSGRFFSWDGSELPW